MVAPGLLPVFDGARVWFPPELYPPPRRERASGTLNILDRFHIMEKFSEALDKVRADAARQLLRDGYEPVLTKSHWCIQKNRENLTADQKVKLQE